MCCGCVEAGPTARLLPLDGAIYGPTCILVPPHLIAGWQKEWEKCIDEYTRDFPLPATDEHDYIRDPRLHPFLFIGHASAKGRYALDSDKIYPPLNILAIETASEDPSKWKRIAQDLDAQFRAHNIHKYKWK